MIRIVALLTRPAKLSTGELPSAAEMLGAWTRSAQDRIMLLTTRHDHDIVFCIQSCAPKLLIIMQIQSSLRTGHPILIR